MHLHEEIRYDAHPEAVFAVLTDPAFLADVSRESGAVEHSEDVRSAGNAVAVLVRRVLPTTGMPDFVARVAGARMAVVQTTTWGPAGQDRSRHGEVDLRIEGAPVSLTGTVHLDPDASAGSRYVLDADLVARVPLLGGRIEAAAAPGLRAALHAEGALAARRLTPGP